MRRLLVIAAALALSACGTASSSNDVKFSGAEKDVADVVGKLATAGQRHNASTICNDILSKQLVAQLKSAGGNCEDEMKDAISDATDYDLQVRSVKINGTTLAPGRYQLTWEGAGSTVQVSIRQGADTVATVPATVETGKAAPAGTGYSTKTEGDGTKSVTSVFFAGKKVSLNLDQQAVAAAQSAGNQGNK